MNTEEILGILLVSSVVSFVVLYLIIEGAVSSANTRLLNNARSQTMLLKKIAEKNGVSEEEISEIINTKKKKNGDPMVKY